MFWKERFKSFNVLPINQAQLREVLGILKREGCLWRKSLALACWNVRSQGRRQNEWFHKKHCAWSWDWQSRNVTRKFSPAAEINPVYHLPKRQAIFRKPDWTISWTSRSVSVSNDESKTCGWTFWVSLQSLLAAQFPGWSKALLYNGGGSISITHVSGNIRIILSYPSLTQFFFSF